MFKFGLKKTKVIKAFKNIIIVGILFFLFIFILCTNKISSQQSSGDTQFHNEVLNQILELYKCVELGTGDTITAKSLCSVENNNVIVDRKIDLKGKVLILPEKSTLCFNDSGKLFNGIIVGNISTVRSNNNRCFFDRVLIDGNWNVKKIYSNWMAFSGLEEINTLNFRNLISLCNDSIKNDIYIDKGNYKVRLMKNDQTVLSLKSNSKLILNGSVSLAGNEFTHYKSILS